MARLEPEGADATAGGRRPPGGAALPRGRGGGARRASRPASDRTRCTSSASTCAGCAARSRPSSRIWSAPDRAGARALARARLALERGARRRGADRLARGAARRALRGPSPRAALADARARGAPRAGAGQAAREAARAFRAAARGSRRVARRLPHLGAPGFARPVSHLRRGGRGETARAGGAAAREPGRDLLVVRQQRVSRGADRGQATALPARAGGPYVPEGKRAVRSLKGLQDVLGEMHDLQILMQTLEAGAERMALERTHALLDAVRAGRRARARRRLAGATWRAGCSRSRPWCATATASSSASSRPPGSSSAARSSSTTLEAAARALDEVRREPLEIERKFLLSSVSRDRARSPEPADRAGLDGGRVDPGAAAPRQRRLRESASIGPSSWAAA